MFPLDLSKISFKKGFIKFVIGAEPETIIFAGDSAGGSLATALTTWTIENGIRQPDGLFIAYPGKKLLKLVMYIKENDYFTPSLLYALDDYLLNYSLLKMVLSYYLQGYKVTKKDYYLCPSLTPDKILQRFPRTEVFVTERDPLRDDTLRFCSRMLKLKKKLRIRFFKYLSHGLMNMAIKNGLPESILFERKIRSGLKKLFNKIEASRA